MKTLSNIRETKVELEEGKKVLAKKGDYVFGKDTNKDINYVTYKGKVIATGYFDSQSDAWWLDIDGIKGDVAFDKKAIDVVNYFIKKNITEAYKSINEGKKELSILVKLEKMNKALMKEVDNLSKGDDAADLHDQIIEMDKATMKMRDVIRKAMKVNPK